MAYILSFVVQIQLKILHDIDKRFPLIVTKIWKWYDESRFCYHRVKIYNFAMSK